MAVGMTSCLFLWLLVLLGSVNSLRTPQGSTPQSLWPQPVQVEWQEGQQVHISGSFDFVSTGASSAVLTYAFARYKTLLFPLADTKRNEGHSMAGVGSLPSLSVAVQSTNSTLTFGVDESYTLTCDISSLSSTPVAKLTANTVYGALRGLETFSQLAVPLNRSSGLSLLCPLTVKDQPRFAYRGLMIDTARHFYPVDSIKHILDSMEASKLNVLHWHVTDDQSFPMQSVTFPELAAKGAFGAAYVYTHEDVKDLVTYAMDRGVHVIPEFDMPAHSASWAASYPNLMVKCSAHPFTHGDTLDPTQDATYTLISEFLQEMSKLFAPPFLHLGGDEVPTTCWGSQANITRWMKDHGITSFGELEKYFVVRVKNTLSLNQNLMYWQEVFQNAPNGSLPKSSIIEAWKSNVIPQVVQQGLMAINSYKWYLNHGCSNDGDGHWNDFYTNDPLHWAPGVSPSQQKLILGGETAMWGECVDAVAFDSIVWPRAAAAAEQLWSPQAVTRNASAALGRMAHHRCRLVQRGIRAAPINSGGYPTRFSPCQ